MSEELKKRYSNSDVELKSRISLSHKRQKVNTELLKCGKKCFSDPVSLLHKCIPSTPLKLLWVIIVGYVPCVVNLKFKESLNTFQNGDRSVIFEKSTSYAS